MNRTECPVKAGNKVSRGWRGILGCTEIKKVGQSADIGSFCLIAAVQYTNGEFGLIRFVQGEGGLVHFDELVEVRSSRWVCNKLIRNSSIMPEVSYTKGKPLHVGVFEGDDEDAVRWSLELYAPVNLWGKDTFNISPGW